jgi:uncharacterized protein YdbL (DUF1318 family)
MLKTDLSIGRSLLGFVVIATMASAQQAPMPVMLGGAGENPHLQTVLDGVADMLSAGNVNIKVVSGEAKSLYATVNQAKGQRGKVLVQCFLAGQQIWEEEARGSLAAMSAEGEVKGMVKTINEKLKKHVAQLAAAKP